MLGPMPWTPSTPSARGTAATPHTARRTPARLPHLPPAVRVQPVRRPGALRAYERPGNVHSAEGWRSVLEPVIARYRERGHRALLPRRRGGSPSRNSIELLEAEGIGYAVRLPANPVLQERIGHLLTRPVGRPPKRPLLYGDMSPPCERCLLNQFSPNVEILPSIDEIFLDMSGFGSKDLPDYPSHASSSGPRGLRLPRRWS